MLMKQNRNLTKTVFKITKNGIDDPISKAEIERTNEWAPKEEGELDELGDWEAPRPVPTPPHPAFIAFHIPIPGTII